MKNNFPHDEALKILGRKVRKDTRENKRRKNMDGFGWRRYAHHITKLSEELSEVKLSEERTWMALGGEDMHIISPS